MDDPDAIPRKTFELFAQVLDLEADGGDLLLFHFLILLLNKMV